MISINHTVENFSTLNKFEAAVNMLHTWASEVFTAARLKHISEVDKNMLLHLQELVSGNLNPSAAIHVRTEVAKALQTIEPEMTQDMLSKEIFMAKRRKAQIKELGLESELSQLLLGKLTPTDADKIEQKLIDCFRAVNPDYTEDECFELIYKK